MINQKEIKCSGTRDFPDCGEINIIKDPLDLSEPGHPGFKDDCNGCGRNFFGEMLIELVFEDDDFQESKIIDTYAEGGTYLNHEIQQFFWDHPNG